MANSVHENSKQAMVSFARKAIGAHIRMLLEVGMTYVEIENGLRLVKRNGNTAWELANPKRKGRKCAKASAPTPIAALPAVPSLAPQPVLQLTQ